MKKRFLLRGLAGAPIGLAISTLITIIISAAVADGSFYPVVPELIQDCGSELNAVILQAVCSLIYGAAWGGASAIWELENWSILKQTAVHLAVCSAATFPTAYFMRWMRHSAAGILSYFAVFFAIYLIIWLTLYFGVKRRVKEMNKRLGERERRDL